MGPPGEDPRTTFLKGALRGGLHRHPEMDLGRLLGILVHFGGPLGLNFQRKTVSFLRSDFVLILDSIWGGAGGRGGACLSLQNLQN